MNLSTERVEHAVLSRLARRSSVVNRRVTRCDGCGRVVASTRTTDVWAGTYGPDCLRVARANPSLAAHHEQYALRVPGEDGPAENRRAHRLANAEPATQPDDDRDEPDVGAVPAADLRALACDFQTDATATMDASADRHAEGEDGSARKLAGSSLAYDDAARRLRALADEHGEGDA